MGSGLPAGLPLRSRSPATRSSLTYGLSSLSPPRQWSTTREDAVMLDSSSAASAPPRRAPASSRRAHLPIHDGRLPNPLPPTRRAPTPRPKMHRGSSMDDYGPMAAGLLPGAVRLHGRGPLSSCSSARALMQLCSVDLCHLQFSVRECSAVWAALQYLPSPSPVHRRLPPTAHGVAVNQHQHCSPLHR